MSEDIKIRITKQTTLNIFFTVLGCILCSIGMNLFLIHARLLSSGVSGICLILQYLFKIPAGISYLIINLPLFFLSYKVMGKKFTIMTILGTLTFSIAFNLTAPFKNLLTIKDPILLCVYGGVLNGLGMGVVLSNYGSLGGLDIIAATIKKKNENFEFSTTSFAINILIITFGAIFFGISSALYTLFSIYISYFVMDKVIIGFNKQKLVMIITNKEEDLSSTIMKHLQRGVTFLYGKGAYTKSDKTVIYCVVSIHQLPLLKRLVSNIDSTSFMSILDISEVHGNGFKGNMF
ncbi:YitT family protein [Clostridium felsineum]|uniref:YitT family protein n=1 Tax=Clostridium felsineum TaxID=36839 RepID=UPI00098BF884|nr:YitT family protein [Clostridium felsineum]URZ18042.1 hypothetical protein CLFE_040970 [Clostridium felsineum DSM 794]